jgi:hypothetical protein
MLGGEEEEWRSVSGSLDSALIQRKICSSPERKEAA